jgi:hypothetical protein
VQFHGLLALHWISTLLSRVRWIPGPQAHSLQEQSVLFLLFYGLFTRFSYVLLASV